MIDRRTDIPSAGVSVGFSMVGSRVLGSAPGGLRALARLERRPLARRTGQRLAKVLSFLVAAGLAAWDGWTLRTLGASEISFAALAAHAGEALTWTSGWLAGFSLAGGPRADDAPTVALAAVRGFHAKAVPAARTIASAALCIESVIPALLLFDIVLFAYAAPRSPVAVSRHAFAMLVTALVAAVAAGLLGALGAACRMLVARRGRALFLGATLLPWLAAQALPGTAGAWSSFPGFIHRLAFAWVATVAGG